ncbi:AI-2E family transporter [Helicobacter saguini]|uniref:AI-2E family transporter n=2 Tax=Helicobacter saguini TaxID=1548018 RepID=A0A347W102_9HELI|nr:AI-2E family transporter [Helicobacter saguini]MWV66360.1 AI-2E family transporter [Helicobacter saguini]MWV68712.1 AI-2E family transporter [Helicobacter saguini]MWV71737.1 AI-2E family transporter [Helicobacter saguini]TLD92185.1 AI-2E family transporter [Helicobacter saguini]
MIMLYYSYLFNMLVAFLLCVSTFWIKILIQRAVKSSFLASLLAVLLMIVLVFLPLLFIFYRAFMSISSFSYDSLLGYFNKLKAFIESIFSHLPLLEKQMPQMLDSISFSQISSYILKFTTTIGESGLRVVIDVCVIVVFLFVFFYWGDFFYSYVKRLLPFKKENIEEVVREVSGTLRVVLLSTFLNVVMQGSAFGIAAYILGFDGILLGISYGICSMIPIVGGTLVWIPVCVVLVFQERIESAIVLGLYSAVFIGFVIDNIIKPYIIGIVNRRVLSKPLNINELIIFFATLAGLSAFGFWGIIIGPAITALFIAMLQMYERDFLVKENG